MICCQLRSLALLLGGVFVLIAGAEPAQAGRRGGGHGGGVRHAGGGHVGGFGAPARLTTFRAAPFYAGGRFTGFSANRFGAAGFRTGFYRSGYRGYGYGSWGFGGGYGFGYPGFGLPGYGSAFLGSIYGLALGLGPYGSAFDPYVPPTPWYDGPLAPATYGPDPPAIVSNQPAAPGKVEVFLPDASAELLFDGKKTDLKGTRRVFPTPNLAPGRRYWYRVSASWMRDGQPVHEERMVYVSAGDTTVVNFRK